MSEDIHPWLVVQPVWWQDWLQSHLEQVLVSIWSAILVGLMVSPICFYAISVLKKRLPMMMLWMLFGYMVLEVSLVVLLLRFLRHQI